MSDQMTSGQPLDPNQRLRLDAAPGARPEGAVAYGPPAVPSADADPLHYVKVLHKRRWLALTIFFLVVGIAAVQVSSETRLYEARTRLLIESDQNVVTFQQVVEERAGNQEYYQTQFNILQSRALARKTLDALRLWNTPPFGGDAQQAFSLREAIFGAPRAVFAWAGRLVGVSDVQQTPEAGETRAQSSAIDTFLSGLVVTPVRNSRLVDVAFRSPDPALATTIVNAHAKAYIDQNLEYKFLASKEASGWLGEQLELQRQEVQKAEIALQRYREQFGAVATEDRANIVTQKLADLSGALTRAKMDRLAKEGAYNQLRENQNNPAALDAFPAIMSNTFIQQQRAELAKLNSELSQLSEKFGDKHPQIVGLQKQIQMNQAKLQAEVLKVVDSVRNEYRAAQQHENSLAAAVAQQTGVAQSMNRDAIQASVLERDVQSNKQIYESLLQRAKETGVSTELRTSNIRVLDPAERPRRPASPKPAQTMSLALVLGAFLALAVAFLLEFLDNRIKHPNEIKVHLGIPALGFLPLLPKRAAERSILLNRGVSEPFAEAFRAIRTNVVFSSAEEGSKTVLVTSTGPGEGKTLVATNLAVALAQAGQRVLLIDGDMRRPKVHETFGMDQEPGLSNMMVGNAKASEAVRKSEVPGLRILTAGRVPPNPAELVGSVRFREFLASLGEHFDWIMIDSPPVMAVTDAAILANGASGVLFVVRADVTSRHTAQAALDQLDASRAKFYGCVLNGLDLDRNAYYYSQIYKREYGAYYTSAART